MTPFPETGLGHYTTARLTVPNVWLAVVVIVVLMFALPPPGIITKTCRDRPSGVLL